VNNEKASDPESEITLEDGADELIIKAGKKIFIRVVK